MRFQILILFVVISFICGRQAAIPKMQNDNITNFNKTPESTETILERKSRGAEEELMNRDVMKTDPSVVTTQSHKKKTSSLFCEPKKFRHNYLMRGGRVQEMLNTWKRGKIGEDVTSHDLCLRQNGMPLTLKCLYNNNTDIAEWDSDVNWDSNSACLRNTSEKIMSSELNTLHNEILENKRLHRGKVGRKEVIENVITLLEQPDYKILPADVYFINKILQAVSAEGADVELTDDVISICNTIMTKDPSTLRQTAKLNSTNELLETFERYMDRLSSELVPSSRCGIVSINTTATNSTNIAHHVETIDRAHIGVFAQISTNITVIHINPNCANISGVAIYDYSTSVHPTVSPTHLMRNSIGKFRFRFVYLNESANELMHEAGLQVATFVPLSLRKPNAHANKQAIIVLKIYTNDSFFVEQSEVQTQKPSSKILSISIPGYPGISIFSEYIPVILRNENYGAATSSNISNNCGYWNYSTWVSQGIEKETQDKAIILCGIYYFTTFSFLLGGSYRQHDLNSKVLITPANMSSLFCEPKKFRHNYLMRGGRVQEMLNTWKRGKIGEDVTSHDLCLRQNGMPLTLKCLHNNNTDIAEWDSHVNWDSNSACLRNTSEKIMSSELNTLHNEILENKRLHRGKVGRKEVIENVITLLEQPDYKILSADVHFTNKILQAVSAEGADVELIDDVISICNTIMTKDPSILRQTAKLNSTNELLETFEKYMDSLSSELVPTSRCGIASANTTTTNSTNIAHHMETIDRAHIGVLAQISTNITVIHINPDCANISGVAIYGYITSVHPTVSPTNLMHNAIGKFRFRFVYLNESAKELMHETGLQVATFVPLSLWEYLRTNIVQPNKPATIVLKIYTNDSLFVEQSEVQTQKPSSKILSISIPGYSVTFPEYLPFILRNENYGTATSSNISSNCGYWNYSTWVSQGVVKQTPDEAVILCGTNHLTPFSFLLGDCYRQHDLNGEVLITPVNQRALDLISLLGSTLSLLGLLGIWVTAALFKSWRKLASTKVLLNLCAALTLQMVLFIFVNTDDMAEELVRDGSYANCMALGALMQYSILVLFSWMLIIAFLQLQRYVTVIGIERPRHYILKSALAAWGLPLIPTLLVFCIDPHSYLPTDYQLRIDSGVCYPSGHGLHFGVILPVSLIVLTNLIIFFYIFYSISHSLNQTSQRQERKMVMRQIRLSVLLFFLLGLSWIFGIFTFMKAGIVFAYLFCLTATIQGFILFIYFILLDELPINAWLNLVLKDRKPKKVVKSTELQPMTNTTGTTSDNRQN